MKNESTHLDDITLIGITARTSNEREMSPETAKIGGMVAAYFGGQLSEKMLNRKTPGVTYAVYTDYESDEHGEYTYFIGEAVESSEGQDTEAFDIITIPAGAYQKFTTAAGKMPNVVIEAWQKIWAMGPADFGAKRSYLADFELYDGRALDPENTEADIFIGIESN